MPPNTISVTRPSTWGNPYVVGMIVNMTEAASQSFKVRDRHHAISLHRDMLQNIKENDPTFFEELVAPLRGNDLACWCKLTDECHADTWLEFANERAIKNGARV